MPLGRQSARHLGAITPPIAPWLLMLGDEAGMLKVLFDPKTRKLLGVHAPRQRATEIIHIRQAVPFYRRSVEYFRDMIFNYPTPAEACKVAALKGPNKTLAVVTVPSWPGNADSNPLRFRTLLSLIRAAAQQIPRQTDKLAQF